MIFFIAGLLFSPPVNSPFSSAQSIEFSSSLTTYAQIPLPTCVKEPADIQKIITFTKKNSDNSSKYDAYRIALASDSDQALAARLIYAETIAANCPTQSANVLPLIAGVINNRVQIRKGDVKSVVFERNQFASSLNHYSSSKYLDFLCPTDALLWTQSMNVVGKKNRDLPIAAVNYFLYKHHAGWDKEPWKLPESKLSLNSNARDCIRVFENKSWK